MSKTPFFALRYKSLQKCEGRSYSTLLGLGVATDTDQKSSQVGRACLLRTSAHSTQTSWKEIEFNLRRHDCLLPI